MPEVADELQQAIDRRVAAAHQGATPKDEDVEALQNDCDDILAEGDCLADGVHEDTIQSLLNDDELIDYLGIEKEEITDDVRIEYARERIVSEMSDVDADLSPRFISIKIKSSNDLEARVFFPSQATHFQKLMWILRGCTHQGMHFG